MKGFEYFSYSTEQWDSIAASVAKMRGVDDVDLIHRGGASLRDLIEVEAGLYCLQGFLNRRAADRQARIDNLIALRDDLRRLVPTLASTTSVDTGNMLEATKAFLDEVTRRINLNLLINAARLKRDDEPTANAAKTSRQKFWSELLAIWIEIGGKSSGGAAARFLIATAEPVGAHADIEAIVKWLDRRQSKTISKIAKPVRRRRVA